MTESSERCPEDGECDGSGWVPRSEELAGHPDGAEAWWWEPCEDCNDEARRVPEAPDREPWETV